MPAVIAARADRSSFASTAWSDDNARMDTHEPDFIVVGEKVALGPLRRDLAAS